jgi:hypothetical protein
MRRRELILALGGTAAWPLAADAQTHDAESSRELRLKLLMRKSW